MQDVSFRALGVSAEYLFIAFKPDLFTPLEDYRRALAAEIAAIKATPRQEGVDEIRIPGERAYRERARLLRAGIEIDRRIQNLGGALDKLSKSTTLSVADKAAFTKQLNDEVTALPRHAAQKLVERTAQAKNRTGVFQAGPAGQQGFDAAPGINVPLEEELDGIRQGLMARRSRDRSQGRSVWRTDHLVKAVKLP
jgi:hypothetical protein